VVDRHVRPFLISSVENAVPSSVLDAPRKVSTLDQPLEPTAAVDKVFSAWNVEPPGSAELMPFGERPASVWEDCLGFSLGLAIALTCSMPAETPAPQRRSARV
jgi:hypothetical protein